MVALFFLQIAQAEGGTLAAAEAGPEQERDNSVVPLALAGGRIQGGQELPGLLFLQGDVGCFLVLGKTSNFAGRVVDQNAALDRLLQKPSGYHQLAGGRVSG